MIDLLRLIDITAVAVVAVWFVGFAFLMGRNL